jgi:hypothetical protein
MHKYEEGDIVWVKVGNRDPFQTKILEKVIRNNGCFYRVEWSAGGFNELLNTVAISENSLEKRT